LAVYLQHRLSEDKDLFTWQQEIDGQKLLSSTQTEFQDVVVESISKKQLDVQINGVKVNWFEWMGEIKKRRNSYKQIEDCILENAFNYESEYSFYVQNIEIIMIYMY